MTTTEETVAAAEARRYEAPPHETPPHETQDGEGAAKAPEVDIVRKIWLAGVGAYDAILAETQGAVKTLTSSATEAFEELVARGETVEEKVRESLSKSPEAEKMAETVEKVTTNAQSFTEKQMSALEEQLARARELMSQALARFNLPAVTQSMDKLAAQVEALTAEVAALKAAKAKDEVAVDA